MAKIDKGGREKGKGWGWWVCVAPLGSLNYPPGGKRGGRSTRVLLIDIGGGGRHTPLPRSVLVVGGGGEKNKKKKKGRNGQ